MKLYHYTHPSKCVDILHGESSGLTPNSFALLEPQPDNWVKNAYFPDFWRRLKAHMGQILLEVDVNPGFDGVIAMDRGHMVKFNSSLPGGSITSNVSQQYAHDTLEQATEAYVRSGIPLLEFLQKSGTFQYTLPEAVITKPVSSKRIIVSQTQPLLEEELAVEDSFGDELAKPRAIDDRIRIAGYYVKRIPELKGWFVEYKRRMESEG